MWSIKQGSAINSADVATGIRQHDAYGSFTFDLPAGTSDDSANPFAQVATATKSAGTSRPSSSEGEDGSSDGSSGGSSSGSSESSSESSSGSGSSNSSLRKAHGTIMAVVFLFLFPIGALLMYLPFSRKTLFAHAPVQVLSAGLLIAGTALGVTLGVRVDSDDGYHQIIGYVVVACLLLFQPALGLIQHLRHRKFGKRTIFGHGHRWLGRVLILLGIVNGGLGLHVSGAVGSEDVPRWAVIVYSIVAPVVAILYLGIVSGVGLSRKREGVSKERPKYANSNGAARGHMNDHWASS
jgi:hypothetical protein